MLTIYTHLTLSSHSPFISGCNSVFFQDTNETIWTLEDRLTANCGHRGPWEFFSLWISSDSLWSWPWDFLSLLLPIWQQQTWGTEGFGDRLLILSTSGFKDFSWLEGLFSFLCCSHMPMVWAQNLWVIGLIYFRESYNGERKWPNLFIWHGSTDSQGEEGESFIFSAESYSVPVNGWNWDEASRL